MIENEMRLELRKFMNELNRIAYIRDVYYLREKMRNSELTSLNFI